MFDAYCEIEGIPGESKKDGFMGQIEILSFSHGIHQPAMASQAAGGHTSGRSEHADFSIVKNLDKASPLLAKYCSDGKVISKVTVTLCRQSGASKKVNFMEYVLSGVIVSGYRPGGASAGQDFPVEEVSFKYNKIEWTYVLQNTDTGAAGGNVKASYDIPTGKSS